MDKLRIAFLSQKGGASKSTFARLVGEYFKEYLPSLSDQEYYKNTNSNQRININFTIYNITRHESSIHRFIDFLPIRKTSIIDSEFVFNGLKDDDFALFDFGADVHEELYQWINTESGKDFASKLNYVFIPARYDHDSKEAMELIINKFKSFSNIVFILCFTDFQDDFYSEFSNYLNDKNFMSFFDLFSSTGRAKMIAIQSNNYIRITDRESTLLSKYALIHQTERDKIFAAMKKIFDPFSYAFYDAKTGFMPKSEIQNKPANTFDSEEIHKLLVTMKDIDSKLTTIQKSAMNEYAIQNFNTIFSESKISIMKRFVMDIKPFQHKLGYIIISLISFTALSVFGIIGYYSGKQSSQIEIRNKLKSEIFIANTLASQLVKTNALSSVYMEYLNGNPVIVCDETSTSCKVRYDKEKHKGYIEILGYENK